MMLHEFRLPDLGEGLTESEVVAWRVAVGDQIALNQVIADIETAKAVVELPSPFAGTIVALHAEAGETMDVGAPLLSIEVAGGEPTATAPGSSAPASSAAASAAPASAAPASSASASSASDDGAVQPNLVGYGAKTESTTARRRTRAAAPSVPSRDAAPAVVAPAEPVATERPRSTPPVRKLARDLGLDLTLIQGTGDFGRITRDDVLNGAAPEPAAMVSAAVTAAAAAPEPGDVRAPIKGVRKATAAAMVASAFTAPHVTEFLTIDVTATTELLKRLKADRAFEGHRITLLTLCAKAVCVAIARNPSLNSSWDESAQEIVQFAAINLGIAAATPRGLVVPHIKDAGRKSFTGLADALSELTTTARAGATQPAELRGGTFTITNIGVFGIDAGTPILNPGEAGILALGAVRSMPWEHHGEIALRQVLTLSLSFDHRVVDGEQGSRFLADVGALLRDPALALVLA